MDSNMIPLSSPKLSGNEWRYIKDCIDTGWVSSVGSYVNRFESFCADYTKRKFAVACINGTSALHTAFLVAGIKPNDEVIAPALTFVAPANAVRYTGAFPVFVDVDKDFWQIDCQKLEAFLKHECTIKKGLPVNRHTGRTIKAIVPVDLLGHPVDMDAILKIARRYNLLVIEDAAESIGAEYKSSKVGQKADITCLSFNGNKVITCGGGGMLVTNNKKWAEQARYLTTQAKDDPIEYIHSEIGYNYRLTNIQAALGLAQMEKLDSYVKIKRSLAKRYDQALSKIEGIELPKEASWAKSTYWLYTILVDKKVYGMDCRTLMHALTKKGIQSRPLWHPLQSLKPFKDCYGHDISVANDLYKRALSIPSSVGLTLKEQTLIIEAICGK
jgi:perosamine synthetase